MDLSYIHQQLKNINLNIDTQTIDDVERFLINDIGFINEIQLDFQIFAALAFISQNKIVPNVSKSGFTNIGIKIQNVMSHLGNLSKEKFLDTLNKQLQKLKNPPQIMKKRVQDIRFSYRFYKKYQTTFEILFKKFLPHSPSLEEFSALFWILYLYIKNSYIETENITEAKALLILLFRAIFENFISQAKFEDIFPILQQNIGAITEISLQKHEFYLSKIGEKMDYFYKQRFPDSHTNFNKMIENYTYLNRLVDDMSTEYIKDQQKLKYFNEIDELSYLELKKNLTPQVFRLCEPAETIQVISKPLSFDDSDQEIQTEQQPEQTPQKKPAIFGDHDLAQTPQIEINTPKSLSPNTTPTWKTLLTPKISSSLLFQDKAESTPISKKIYNEKWMNEIIQSVSQQKLHQFFQFFNHLDQNKMQESQNICDFFKQKIHQLITNFTPKCQDYEQRHAKMFSFFLGNLSEIKNQNQSMFNDQSGNGSKIRELLIGIGALSCEIFNYINNSISYEFKHHFEAFGLTISAAVQSFELFESFIMKKMPIDLKSYLENVKKRFMVSDIWQNEGGFKILFSSQTEPLYNEIRSKIYTFTKKRIQQICHQARIESKIISKTISIMKFILDQKSYLLKKNNIDQIILCCIMSCLSINQKQEHQSLELLFQSYNSNIQFAFNSNQLGLKDNQGNEMKIIDYYNEVFLQQIQDLLTENQSQLDDFLLTPVRINHSFNITSIDKNINRFKQKQFAGNFLFNPEKSLPRNSYRKQLLKQAKQMEMKEQKQQNQQDPPSPTFGMSRHFSFGSGSSKD